MPSDSQPLRKRTESRSTSDTSANSNSIGAALAASCVFNSGRCSARIRPISLMVVQRSPAIFSIFNVTLTCHSNERAVQEGSERQGFAEFEDAVFSEISEFWAGTEWLLEYWPT